MSLLCLQCLPLQGISLCYMIPLFLLLLYLLQFLQVLLGHFDDLIGLLLWGQHRGRERAWAAVQRGAGRGSRQVLPQVFIHSLALKKFSSEIGYTKRRYDDSLMQYIYIYTSLATFC